MSKWIAFTDLRQELYLLDTTNGELHQFISQLRVEHYDWTGRPMDAILPVLS